MYAIPSNVRREPENVRRTTNLEELFDGECYATTYQSNNGQCHIYQELPEASLAAKQRARSTSMVASHEVLSHSRPPIPLRITASSASVSNFPYTMPNTPALSVFDLETKPSVQVFPYTEARPNTSYSDRKSTSSPYVESIPSLAGSSETKPSTTSTLPFTPEDTPVSLQECVLKIDSTAQTNHNILVHGCYSTSCYTVIRLLGVSCMPSSQTCVPFLFLLLKQVRKELRSWCT